MKIKLIIFPPLIKNKFVEPEKFEFKGNYAIETLLIKISEKYFGVKISRKIEDLLKTKLGE